MYTLQTKFYNYTTYKLKSMKKKMSAVLCMALAMVLPSFAQGSERDYEPYPYGFISLQGGGQVTFTNASFDKLATPVGAVSLGGFFTPAVGIRLNVQGFDNRGGYRINGNDLTYDFKNVTSDIDLMFNLSNIIFPKKTHAFNVMLIGGVGFSYAWDNNEQMNVVEANRIREAMAWEEHRLVHNFRVGMQFEYNVAKHWGINLEVAANNLHDRFNSKLNGNNDWQATALLGVTYKFGFKKKNRTYVNSALAKQEYDNSRNQNQAVATAPTVADKKPAPKPAPAPAPAPVEKPKEKKDIAVFFTINSSEVSAAEDAKIADFAQWLKQHPTAKVNLTAYADAGTGNTTINKTISQKRVKAVARLLIDKHGIAADRIITDFKGDTVQPFSENDKNRVTLGVAQEN